MEFALLLAALAFLVTFFVLALVRTRPALRAAYEAGYVAGLRRARAIVRERASVAVELAPAGQLPHAMVRAQMAHQIEADLDSAIVSEPNWRSSERRQF